MHESFFKMKDFYKKCNKPLQTEKSCHTFAHNQSNQINQLSNCDLFFSGFVGQGLFLPTLFFGCFLKCEISVFGMMLSVLVRVSWRMLFFSSWKCFGILGSRTWIFIFFCCFFSLYICDKKYQQVKQVFLFVDEAYLEDWNPGGLFYTWIFFVFYKCCSNLVSIWPIEDCVSCCWDFSITVVPD